MSISNDTKIKVTNRYSGTVGYDVPDLNNLHRNFYPRQTKEVTFEELFKLASTPGGERLLKDYLVVKDYDAVKQLFGSVEPEYYYTEDDIKKLMVTGSLEAFEDCVDFAPDGVIDIIKNLAVSMPLNDVSKRDYLKKKTGFDVESAIKIKNTKSEEEKEMAKNNINSKPEGRRVAAPSAKRRITVTDKD